MTNAGSEREGSSPRQDHKIAAPNGLEDLAIAHEIALRVDGLGLGPAVRVSLQRVPTSTEPNQADLLFSGTPTQIDVIKRALKIQREAIEAGLNELGVKAEMENFFHLQGLRYGLNQ